MNKLMTATFIVLLATFLGAQTPPTQKPPAQAPATQAAPQTPPKPVAPPPAQTPPTTQTPPAAPKPAAPAQAAARTSATLFVTGPTGTPIPDATITLSGPTDREVVTTRDAATRITNLRAGTYRARFDAPNYILFEKELVMRPGQAWEFEVMLNPAPAKKVEAPAAPPPTPARQPAATSPEPSGEVSMLSLSDWLDRNLIGRNEPQKDSPVGSTAGASASVFQVRENISDREHPEADELLYVIAGEATARIGDRAQTISPGWFVTIPRGTSFSLERRGRNPLILLSVVAPGKGAPPGPR